MLDSNLPWNMIYFKEKFAILKIATYLKYMKCFTPEKRS
jgi:hypothetical protein